jgi:hypothetical protein
VFLDLKRERKSCTLTVAVFDPPRRKKEKVQEKKRICQQSEGGHIYSHVPLGFTRREVLPLTGDMRPLVARFSSCDHSSSSQRHLKIGSQETMSTVGSRHGGSYLCHFGLLVAHGAWLLIF